MKSIWEKTIRNRPAFAPHTRGYGTGRKPQRLKSFDYSTDGAYFITICTANRENFFGEIVNGKMILNACGEIVNQQWEWLAAQYPFVSLDEFIVMPNHFHGVLFIDRMVGDDGGCVGDDAGVVDGGGVGNGRDHSLRCNNDSVNHADHSLRCDVDSIKPQKIKSLSELVGAFKTTSSKRIHRETPQENFAWQKSFYDRIIRDDEELNRIREYIWANPANWETDENYFPIRLRRKSKESE